MRWFFRTFAAVSAVLCLSFVGWIVTRAMHAEAANRIVGHIMIGDLCAVTVMLAYSAFVGAWYLWEGFAERVDTGEPCAKTHPSEERAARLR